MANTFTSLLYHFVWSTKDRQPLIAPDLQAPLHKFIGGIIRKAGGSMIEIGGVADHLHIATRLPADVSVADMAKAMKAKSSGWINKHHPRGPRFHWQRGYGAFTVSRSQLPALVRYIQGQQEHHRQVSFKDELIALLKKHGIDYDERYLLD